MRNKIVIKGLAVIVGGLILLAVIGIVILFEVHSFSATVRGRITNPEGAPISGAKVSLFVGGSDGRSVHFEEKTNQNGLYMITVPRIQYALDTSAASRIMRIKADGYIPVSVNKRISRGFNPNWNFELTKAVTVSGRVVDTKGNPMRNAGLYLSVVSQKCKQADLRFDSPYGNTDKDGCFYFDTVGPFEYCFSIDNRSKKYYRQKPVKGGTIDLSNPANHKGHVVYFNDPNDYSVSGIVKDHQGNMLKNAWVWIPGQQSGTWASSTDQNGAFCIIGLDGYGKDIYDVCVRYQTPGGKYYKAVMPDISLNTKDLEIIMNQERLTLN